MVKQTEAPVVKKTASDVKRRQLARRFHKLKVKPSQRGILYVGHLPKGFNENELREFFQQFGQVTKLRVARSKKTARTKGYAFLEFQEAPVAAVAAKAMDKYIMFGRQLDVHVMNETHHEMFRDGNRDWKFVPTQEMYRNKKNAEKGPADMAARVRGLLAKEKEKRDRLKELGIEYDFPGYKACVGSLKPGNLTPKKAQKEEPKKEKLEVVGKKVEIKAEKKAAKADKKSEKKEAPAKVEKKEVAKPAKAEKKEVAKVEKKEVVKAEKPVKEQKSKKVESKPEPKVTRAKAEKAEKVEAKPAKAEKKEAAKPKKAEAPKRETRSKPAAVEKSAPKATRSKAIKK